MAHQIKLDVFTVKLKKRNVSELLQFKDFVSITNEEDKFKNFSDFFTSYVKSFENKFVVQDLTGKAISITNNAIKFGSRRRVIYGTIEGGVTGIGSRIKSRDNSSDEGSFHVTAEKVNSIPYYFMLWVPENTNIGLLIVQGYSDRSISEPFKVHLKKFFSTKVHGFSLWLDNLIPADIAEKMTKNGTINTITLRKYHLPSSKGEKLLGINYTADKDLTIEVKISGLKNIPEMAKKLGDYITGKVHNLIDISPLEEVGFDENYETFVKFEHNGKTATALVKHNNIDIAPSYYVEKEDVHIDENKHPVFNSIHKYVQDFLETLKTQIGYEET